MSNQLLIWDKGVTVPNFDGRVIYWQSAPQDSTTGSWSILEYCEKNADEIKKSFLEEGQNLAKLDIGGNVFARLAIDQDFSLWWMSLCAERSNFSKSRQIEQNVRLIGLEKFIEEHNISEVSICTKNPLLYYSIRDLCKFKRIKILKPALQNLWFAILKLKYSFDIYLMPLKAIGWLLLFLWKNRALINQDPVMLNDCKKSVLLVSYFEPSFEVDEHGGIDTSRYWGPLPKLLRDAKIPTIWLHHFVTINEALSGKYAASLLDKMNKNSASYQTHLFLLNFLSLKIILRALKKWIGVIFQNLKLLSIIRHLTVRQRTYFHFSQNDFHNSWFGKISLENLILFYLYKEFFEQFNGFHSCYYIAENQNWEMALLHLWKKHNTGPIFAHLHSTVRFWDLRYFPASWEYELQLPRPRPEKYIVNGEQARYNLRSSGMSEDMISILPALRFPLDSDIQAIKQKKSISEKIQIVIFGEFNLIDSKSLFNQVDLALSYIHHQYDAIFKPHPISTFEVGRTRCNIKRSLKDANDLIANADIVITGNQSSVAIDAFTASVPVVVFSDPKYLNFSPLRGLPNVSFFSNYKQLARILSNYQKEELQLRELDLIWRTNNYHSWVRHFSENMKPREF